MDIAKVNRMTADELAEFLGDRVCRERGCYRETARGYVLCLQCLHGTSQRADDVYVAAKKRLERLRRKPAESD